MKLPLLLRASRFFSRDHSEKLLQPWQRQ